MGSAMNRFDFSPTPLEGLFTVTPKPLKDERGLFERFFCKNEFKALGFEKEIVQINRSVTAKKGSVRGMHYQKPPFGETKIIRCIQGAVFDVAVDVREGSPTFLQWFGEVLSEENGKYMFIPEGFAHGFQTLEDNTQMIYLHTNFYSKESEGAINYSDPKLAINWPLTPVDISTKDATCPFLENSFKGIKV